MKKIAFYLMAAVVLFTACDNEIDKSDFMYEPAPIPVTGVTLNHEVDTIALNSVISLEATIAPARASNKDVTWSSSNSEIALVNENGGVSAVGVGDADITVTTVDGNKTAVCKITVVKGFLVTGVKLNLKEMTLIVGEDGYLKPTIEPENATNKFVTWSSSDETKATVASDGKVVGIAPGEAIITVTTEDGEFEASCEVTVLRPVEEVRITLPGSTAKLEEVELQVGQTITIATHVLPLDASNKELKWSLEPSIEPNSFTMSFDEVRGELTVTRTHASGGLTVTVTSVDGGKTAVCDFISLDPMILLAGKESKAWTWDEKAPLVFGNGGYLSDTAPGWWGQSAGDLDQMEGENKGAYMTFSSKGMTLVKTRTNDTKANGTFALDMTKTKMNAGGDALWSIGVLDTQDVTVLVGMQPNNDKAPVYHYDILRLSPRNMVLAWPEEGDGGGAWSTCWYWMFGAK
ncbi:MAG: Ig-like domain-containing protein [Dysgonamonadaceae bacterium]|jgi:uncharacterized protein YjdB|nr:Ig-like domain-containing protein [Dysgonamonadaceae bacterium]